MKWIGKWRNQYGSLLTITDDKDGVLAGTFRTALEDSGFFGLELTISGIHQGACMSFSFAGRTDSGDAISSFTGLYRDGKIETLWYVIVDGIKDHPEQKRSWPHAALTNADTFTPVI